MNKKIKKIQKIGLFDYENTNYPNLVLMKLSAYHKSKGDSVEFWNGPMVKYDKVYASKIFTWTKENKYLPKKIKKGGTGFFDSMDSKNSKKTPPNLPDKIEHICPDYSLYPNIKKTNTSYGFLTRGCPNNCPWCFVPKKEGKIRKHADIDEFTKHKNVILMDNNVLAHDHGIHQIEKIAKMGLKIDFNQGLDARRIDKSIAKLLSKVKWLSPLRMACDSSSYMGDLRKAIELLRWYDVTPRNYFIYVLIKDIPSALERIKFLKGMAVTPFAQPYRDLKGTTPKRELRDFARWVNTHRSFYVCTWNEYKREIGYHI